jgi:putative ABC transport system permease protein
MGAQMMKNDSMQSVGARVAFIRVDYGFFKTYGIEFAGGRDFSKEIPTDDSIAFILNEAAIDAMGIKDPLEALNQDFTYGGTQGKIVGIVKDFHFESLHEQINPVVFFIGSNNYNRISIQIAGDNFQQGLEHIEKLWREYMPDRLFEYDFLDDRYQKLYESEMKQSQLFTGFSVLAIFIGCLGLFGLATFNTMQRVKEIGIRKVLGASVPHILVLLSREIIILVLIANILAWPLAWYFMDKWLSSFAYRIDLNIGIFVGAAISATLVALFTVSTKTIKAAMTNPSNTLRYE